MSQSKKQAKEPRTNPEEGELWVKKFNEFFENNSDSGIIFIFAGSIKLKEAKMIVEKEDFHNLKKFSHKMILLKEPQATFIASKDLEKNDFHINIVFNDIGDDACFNSQSILSQLSIEINPSGSDHYVFVMKTKNFSKEEDNWINTEIGNMSSRCSACALNLKEAQHEHFGVPKEKILAATGSR